MSQEIDSVQLNNLDKDFSDMLLPLNIMQTVLLQPKYRISRGAVKQNNAFTNAICLLGFTFVILTNSVRFFENYDDTPKNSGFMYAISVIDALLYIIFCVLICILNVYQSKNNVLLVLKMQQAHRNIAAKGDLTKHRNSTWFCITSVFCVYLLFLEGNRQIGLLNTRYVLYVISLAYFDGNIVFATRIINFLVYEVKLWLVEMDRFEAMCSQTDHAQLRKYLDDMKRRQKALFKAWMDIVGSFQLCGKIFHLQILMRAVEIFVHPLFYIQMFIEISKTIKFFFGAPLMATVSILILMTLIAKNLVLLVCVSLASEQFTLAVAEVDVACTRLCAEGCLTDVHLLRKNVFRLNACARDSGLRAGGAVAVDAGLPLRLLASLATYTVVLLQFAFL